MRFMTRRGGLAHVGAATALAVLSVLLLSLAAFGQAAVISPLEVLSMALDFVPIALGWLVWRGAPVSVIGPALTWAGAATVTTRAVEVWGLTDTSAAPWWGSGAVAVLGPGVWPWQLMGFVALVMLFPDGLLPGRRWRVVTALGPAAAMMINVGLSGTGPGEDNPPTGWQLPLLLSGLLVLLVCLGGAVWSLAVRFRTGEPHVRGQLRWMLLATSSVPVLLVAGWILAGLGVPAEVAYGGFLVGVLVLVPAAVAVAVLQHDLLDIDELVSSSVAALLTSLASAGIFAGTVWLLGSGLTGPSGLGPTGAAFVTALCLLPLYRRLHHVVGRVTDRERTVALAAVGRFIEQVRDGTAAPEQIEDVLRVALDDPNLRLGLMVPGTPGLVDLRGGDILTGSPANEVSLRTGDVEVGVLCLGRPSARRRRLAIAATTAARLPIEMSRLRLELRSTLADVTSSRSRLVTAVTEERRRLERDLHDGAQQSIVAVGMRLRSIQRRLPGDAAAREELDGAVEALEHTVAELRRIAHGVRPSRLDDGLTVALRALSVVTPVPLDVSVCELPTDGGKNDTLVTTAYFVVAEAVANAWKHAQADHVVVRVEEIEGTDGTGLRVEVCDDGVGGVEPATSLTALRDRVASVGGRLDVVSPVGGGTRVTALL